MLRAVSARNGEESLPFSESNGGDVKTDLKAFLSPDLPLAVLVDLIVWVPRGRDHARLGIVNELPALVSPRRGGGRGWGNIHSSPGGRLACDQAIKHQTIKFP